MKNEKKQLEAPWRAALHKASRRVRAGARRYAQPVVSGFLALTMVIGSVPAPAYAEMMDEAARSLALMMQDAESASDADESGDDQTPSMAQAASEQNGTASKRM